MKRTSKKTRCLVIGGSGFIGLTVVERLLEEGYQVRIFAKPSRALQSKRTSVTDLEWFYGDFQNKSDINQALTGIDSVIHLASTAVPQSASNDPGWDLTTNVLPTIQLVDAMVKQGIRSIVFASSGGTVYGPTHDALITEDHPTNPIVAYGVSKLAIEKYLLLYKAHNKIEPIILRIANVYGERQVLNKEQGAVGVFLSKAMGRLPIEIWGDGSVTRDYVYVGDVAKAFVAAIEYSGKYSIFNIGMGQGTSLNELIQHIDAALGIPCNVQYQRARTFDTPINVLNISLAKAELNWKPKISVCEGLKKTIVWAKTTRSWE